MASVTGAVSLLRLCPQADVIAAAAATAVTADENQWEDRMVLYHAVLLLCCAASKLMFFYAIPRLKMQYRYRAEIQELQWFQSRG